MKIRIRIREQLCFLIAITSLLALMVLAVSTWVQSRHYLMESRQQTLQVTANLKADQLSQDLRLFQEAVQSITTRDVLQGYVRGYDNGNTTDELRNALATNMDHALSAGSEDAIYLQGAVYARDDSNSGALIVNTTGTGARRFTLPYTYPNGTAVMFGDPGLGYPPTLYPNLTFNGDNSTVRYDNRVLNYTSSLLLGPLYLPKDNITLISFTVAINNNTSRTEVLGWLTVVLDARNMYDIINSRVGLGHSGEVVIIGPDRVNNLFERDIMGMPAANIEDIEVQFKLPPYAARHPARKDDPYLPFPMRWYPAIVRAWSTDSGSINNAGTLWKTHNENNASIAVGYAIVDSPIVDWVVVFGQARSEVNGPINSLRNTVLACVFSVVGAIIIVCFPIAHYAVKPIDALRTATDNSVMTYETYAPPSIKSNKSDTGTENTEKSLLSWANDAEKGECRLTGKVDKKKSKGKKVRSFQIPQRVPDRKHFIHDELTDLTYKFNDMSDELGIQYAKLEDRVKDRTAELEKSRNEAQAANESKTLFIANVSHELRTPLNGIIGMCAVAMQEEDVKRIRQSLKIIYKSSDLLLHLLNDLLTFSRSSYGQQLSIEENTFRLVDVGNQLISIFEKQAKDADVGLKVVFLGADSTYPNSEDEPEDAIIARRDVAGNLRRVETSVLARGPADVGPLRQVGLRGDKNRILQILMNLVSNSLKFTPAKGQIEVRIRCRGMVDMALAADDMSNANTLDDTTDTANDSIPQIKVRKPSGKEPDLPNQAASKGLVFDFEVEDTGAGIPGHLQKEVFKPFVQGDLALSKKHGGTGLGLSICSQLAELMGGDISLKSTPDIGSTFTLRLPLKYTKETVPSVSGSLARSGRRGSMTSSVQFETFSNRSGMSRQRPPHRSPQSKGTSIVSVENAPGMEKPRIVGFSQPFILDDDDDDEAEDRPKEPDRRSTSYHRPRLEAIASASQDGPSMLQTLHSGIETPAETSGEKHTASLRPPISQATTATSLSGALHTEPPATPAPEPSDADSPPPFRVLVAEDNPINQQVILRLLKLEKISDITLAEDGLQALDFVQHSLSNPSTMQPYSLIFMDIQMPRMDGIEATKKIRELGFEAPIVALTAFDHESNRKGCEEVGMNAFLGKPIKRTALKRVLGGFGRAVGSAGSRQEKVGGVAEATKADDSKEGGATTEY
ncbi:Two-component system protein B [Cyphellophora attinorum]|uniref:histidine kinase n=1 Tax=Cyphellophora attinorum TaxID=1664694 RepID=A0A0N1H9U5_9EURO|nr:Two-component system protein B [Phialophora attinorum]KPI40547.1 Two-component system protein B [Phialophora attinorum]